MEKEKLFPYSNSRLVDLNQCPTWGVVHAKRQYSTHSRAMALEAGETMHQMFAAVRIWQLRYIQKLPKHALVTGNRIFGVERHVAAWNSCDTHDKRDSLIQFCFAILHSSQWEDEQSDRIRTMANMELATITYCDERLPLMDAYPIWVEDRKKPAGKVGIEQVFDVVLRYADGKRIRYIGTIDGLVLNTQFGDRKTLEENKTASRLEDAWKLSFELSHQVSAYTACSTTVFGFPVLHARIWGVKIKPSTRGEDVRAVDVERDYDKITKWAAWLRWTVETLHEPYEKDYENAPRFTHSCNRYFRPCSLIAFCADTPEGRIEQYEQMVEVDKSPSERAIMEL